MPIARAKKKKPRKEASGEEQEVVSEPAIEMDGMANPRSSDSREPLTPEQHDIPPQKKKRKKKAQPLDEEGEQQDMSNGDMVEQPTDAEEVTKKSKRKRKSKMAEMQYVDELGVEEDDVITDAQPPIPQHSLFSAPPGHSQPVGRVFVERSRRFQAAELPRHPDQTEHMDYLEVPPVWTTRDVAMRVHSSFRVVGLFSHGFLAGYAVWNIIVIYVLAGEEMTTLPNLLQQYYPLAYPAQSLLYLLLAVSTVSAFDRVNVAKATLALRGFLTLDPAALASVLYFIALILSLSQQMTSDRINLYPLANETLWPPGSEYQVLQPWMVVNLVVALLVGLAWVFISTRPDTDYTEDFLMSMEVEDYPRHEERVDLKH